MWRRYFYLLVVFTCLTTAASAQYGGYPRPRRTPSTRPGGTAENQGLAGTFHGTLKQLTKKEIVIQNADEQDVVIRVSKKTKFWKDGKALKPNDLEPGMIVSIDAAEDIDMKPIAASVTVEVLRKEASAAAK
jgi:hypothetical protein